MLEISILINKQINQMTNKIMTFNEFIAEVAGRKLIEYRYGILEEDRYGILEEEIVNSGLSDNINIQNAFAELTNHSLENSLYWINQYLKDCKDDKIIKIKKLLEFSQANIDEAFTILDNIVSEEIVKSGLSDNINIQNAFAELTNNIENSLYWINQYLKDCKDDKIIKIKKLLEFSQANIDEAFVILDNIVSM